MTKNNLINKTGREFRAFCSFELKEQPSSSGSGAILKISNIAFFLKTPKGANFSTILIFVVLEAYCSLLASNITSLP